MVYSLIFCNKDEVIYSLNAALLTLYIVQTAAVFTLIIQCSQYSQYWSPCITDWQLLGANKDQIFSGS